jgi:hypothetical protein
MGLNVVINGYNGLGGAGLNLQMGSGSGLGGAGLDAGGVFPGDVYALLLEDGTDLLLENGNYFELETGS